MKKAIVIGASSGMGKELAKILTQKDYTVGITGRRKKELEKLKQTHPNRYTIRSFDCTREHNSKQLTHLTEELGGLDLFVLSSGNGALNNALDFKIEHKTNLLNVNAFTELVGWAFNYFEKQGRGHLVVISSIAGIRGSKIAPAYNASKAYQINYLEGLRQKAFQSKKSIHITDIRPGLVDTDMAKGEGLFWIAPKEKAAQQIFSLIKRQKEVGYVTKRWWLIAKLLKILPTAIYKRM
jgi:short-subunit dehydrogenase